MPVCYCSTSIIYPTIASMVPIQGTRGVLKCLKVTTIHSTPQNLYFGTSSRKWTQAGH